MNSMKDAQIKRMDAALNIIRDIIISESSNKTTGTIQISIDMNEGGIKDRICTDVKKSRVLQ